MIDFDEHPLFMFARLLAEAVLRTEDASGGQVLLLARHAFEDAFNVAGCRFCAFENAFDGAGGCLAHL